MLQLPVVCDVEELESVVGARPAVFHLKSIPYLDEHATAILARSGFSILAVAASDGSLRTALLGGTDGVLAPASPGVLRLPAVDLGAEVADGAPAALLTFVAGWRETLRINGRLRVAADASAGAGSGAGPAVEVEEVFLHCAKALIRSRFWGESTPPVLPSVDTAADGTTTLADPGVVALLAASPFVALASIDAGGEADVSPKGDPAGFVVQIVDDRTLAVADRPGNKRTDTMHNLVSRTDLALVALVPGLDVVLSARGRGAVTTDAAVLAGLAVEGKVPKAAVLLEVEHLTVADDPAIAAAGLWDPSRHVAAVTLPKATQIWVDHVKRNEDRGLVAKAARKVVNVKMMDKGIEADYRNNLY